MKPSLTAYKESTNDILRLFDKIRKRKRSLTVLNTCGVLISEDNPGAKVIYQKNETYVQLKCLSLCT